MFFVHWAIVWNEIHGSESFAGEQVVDNGKRSCRNTKELQEYEGAAAMKMLHFKWKDQRKARGKRQKNGRVRETYTSTHTQG